MPPNNRPVGNTAAESHPGPGREPLLPNLSWIFGQLRQIFGVRAEHILDKTSDIKLWLMKKTRLYLKSNIE
jgi:hypothetical protein